MKTQAALLTQKGAPDKAFKLAEIELNRPQATEVLVEIEAFGLNYIDVALRLGTYSEKPTLPCVLGQEVVGNIVQVGKAVDADFLGKRVVAFTARGGYARHALVSVDSLAEIGQTDANTALALALQGITAYYMCCRICPIFPGENVLIHAAAGGVGTLLIQLAKNAGARVIAKVGSEEKRHKCLALGADFAVNYKASDYVAEVEKLIGNHHLDVSFNPVAGHTFRQDRRLLGHGSRLVLFGGLELAKSGFGPLSQLCFLGKMGIILPIFLSIDSQSIIGVDVLKLVQSKPQVVKQCLEEILVLYRQGRIKPKNGGDFAITELGKAHDLLESGYSMGKLAVHW